MTIELFVYVFIACMMVVCLNFLYRAGIVRKSDKIYSLLLLSLIAIQIFIVIFFQFFPNASDSNLSLTLIYLGPLLGLLFIYIITHLTVASAEIQEDGRVWIGWTMFLVLAASLCALVMELPGTMTDLYRIPFAVTLCFGIQYYPLVLNRLNKLNTAAEERMVEKRIEGHKESVITLAIDSLRFAKDYQRILTRLNNNQTKRHERKLQQFVKKTEESLSGIGLRVVNVEGYPYDPGMAATPLNIEDFEPDDQLVVDQMLEPIIMEGTVLAKTGTVILRRKE